MAQVIQATAAPGRALTAKILQFNTNTEVASASGVEALSSLYDFSYTGVPNGTYRFLIIDDLTSIGAATYSVDITASSGTFQANDSSSVDIPDIVTAVMVALPGSYAAPDNTAQLLIDAAANNAGSGSVQVPFTIEANGQPVSGVKCWVSTDVNGSNIVTGDLITDDFGNVKFLLDPGVYYLWRDSSFYQFPSPVSFTAS
jgi:hypothetical protein